jgi:CRP/FNR family cyclic AMP-dependent transcriptional regulator
MVLVGRNYSSNNLVRLLPKAVAAPAKTEFYPRSEAWRGPLGPIDGWTPAHDLQTAPQVEPQTEAGRNEIDALYLFACQVEWQRRADPSSAWEIIAAARSSDENTRAHARSLLEKIQEPTYPPNTTDEFDQTERFTSRKEAAMRTPYGLDVIESCMGCKASHDNFFCRFSPNVLRSLDSASYHSVMPPGALLFVEGQSPRGVYVLCSGKVKLSTTSKEGKVLILKQAEAGEVLGLSAAISGTNYEMSAETCTPCQLNFVSRHDLTALLQNQSEVGVHAAQSLSREFQSAYRDIHDLVLARSSSGKLARLLLSCAPEGNKEAEEQRLRAAMTHEEMAQRIGSSRETVTRLLSTLKKKRLIRLEGATLVIRDRSGLEALAM